MSRVLPPTGFKAWFDRFLPGLAPGRAGLLVDAGGRLRPR
jgi:hypothetical protein